MKRLSKINIHAFLMALIFLGILFDGNLSLLSYLDEIATLVFGMYIISAAYKRKIPKDRKVIIYALLVMTILGIISNKLSRLAPNLSSVIIDILWLYKVFFGYIGISLVLKSKQRMEAFFSYVVWVAKLFILVSLPFAIANIYMDIGMSADMKYGLRCYSFIVGNSGHYGLRVAACLAVIMMKESRHSRKVLCYTIAGLAEILMTLKMMPILIVIVYAYFCFVNSGRKVTIQNPTTKFNL